MIAQRQIKQAMLEAGAALDQQTQEIAALKRILISERAQVIYYTDKYEACMKKECLDLKPIGFLELPEEVQVTYTKRAVEELSANAGIVPHDPDAAAAQKAASQIGRGIIQ